MSPARSGWRRPRARNSADRVRLAPPPTPSRFRPFNGLSTRDAETILRERRLRLGQVHRRASNACPNGGIVAQSPPRGQNSQTRHHHRSGDHHPVAMRLPRVRPYPSYWASHPRKLSPFSDAKAWISARSSVKVLLRPSAPSSLSHQRPGSPSTRGSRINITVASEVRIPDLRTAQPRRRDQEAPGILTGPWPGERRELSRNRTARSSSNGRSRACRPPLMIRSISLSPKDRRSRTCVR